MTNLVFHEQTVFSAISFVVWQLMQGVNVGRDGRPVAWPTLSNMRISDLFALRLALPSDWGVPPAPVTFLAPTLLADRLLLLDDTSFEGDKLAVLDWGTSVWERYQGMAVMSILGFFEGAATLRAPLGTTCAAYLDAWLDASEQG